MVYFIDANIFLRIIVKENEKSFDDCSNLLQSVLKGEIKAVSSNIILAEIVWVLNSYYKLSKDKIVEALKRINSIGGLKLVDKFDSNLALEYFAQKSVKYIDCLIVSITEIDNRKWTIVSYDRDFDKIGVLRKEPRDIVPKN